MNCIFPYPRSLKSAACVLCIVSAGAFAAEARPSLDTAQIEQITGLKGSYSREENVFKVAKARTDVSVAVDDWAMPPFMGLGSWAAFTPAGGGNALVMGDTVLFEDEVNAVMSVALEAIFGSKGMASNGMFKVVIGRAATMEGIAIGKEMGVNTWAAFGGSDDHAVVDGDIVMTEDQLQPTLKSLRASGINIVAIHQHMTGEQPHLLFLHYWGKGKAAELARAVKRAAMPETSRR